MEEFRELKKITQDIVKLSNKISSEHVKPLQEKLDSLSMVTDKVLQKLSEANKEIIEMREAISKAGDKLSNLFKE